MVNPLYTIIYYRQILFNRPACRCFFLRITLKIRTLGEIGLAHIHLSHCHSTTDWRIATPTGALTLPMTLYVPTSDGNLVRFGVHNSAFTRLNSIFVFVLYSAKTGISDQLLAASLLSSERKRLMLRNIRLDHPSIRRSVCPQNG